MSRYCFAAGSMVVHPIAATQHTFSRGFGFRQGSVRSCSTSWRSSFTIYTFDQHASGLSTSGILGGRSGNRLVGKSSGAAGDFLKKVTPLMPGAVVSPLSSFIQEWQPRRMLEGRAPWEVESYGCFGLSEDVDGQAIPAMAM